MGDQSYIVTLLLIGWVHTQNDPSSVLFGNKESMGLCKNDVTPLLMHRIYILLALTHRNVLEHMEQASDF